VIGRDDRCGCLVALDGFDGGNTTTTGETCRSTCSTATPSMRIAIVGPERWRSQALIFAVADLRKGPVEFFSGPAMADSRAWLAAEPTPPTRQPGRMT
jgi:hypothetical protein